MQQHSQMETLAIARMHGVDSTDGFRFEDCGGGFMRNALFAPVPFVLIPCVEFRNLIVHQSPGKLILLAKKKESRECRVLGLNCGYLLGSFSIEVNALAILQMNV